MQIELVLKGLQLGRYARERIEHKIGKSLDRLRRDVPVRVLVEDHKGQYLARVSAALNQRDFVGQSESRSMLEAVDEAIVKFDRQITRLQDRHSSRDRHRSARHSGARLTDLLAVDEVDPADEYDLMDSYQTAQH